MVFLSVGVGAMGVARMLPPHRGVTMRARVARGGATDVDPDATHDDVAARAEAGSGCGRLQEPDRRAVVRHALQVAGIGDRREPLQHHPRHADIAELA